MEVAHQEAVDVRFFPNTWHRTR